MVKDLLRHDVKLHCFVVGLCFVSIHNYWQSSRTTRTSGAEFHWLTIRAITRSTLQTPGLLSSGNVLCLYQTQSD